MKIRKTVPFIALLLLLITVLFGGPKLSSFLTESYKSKIDRKAVEISAVVYLKKTHKGNTVHFRYIYDGKEYENDEQDDKWYTTLNIGDTIRINVDSTDPSSSYIVE